MREKHDETLKVVEMIEHEDGSLTGTFDCTDAIIAQGMEEIQKAKYYMEYYKDKPPVWFKWYFRVEPLKAGVEKLRERKETR